MSVSTLRSAFRYRVARHLLIGPALFVWGRPKITGQGHIPRRGPVILASNHLAISDSFYVVLCARRPVMFLAKSDYFTAPGVRGKFKKVFFSGMGQIPVDRSGGAAASPAITAATSILKSGGAWGIHPEGTRSPDGRLYKGHTGVIRVAVATGTPVIPIALTGTDGRTLSTFRHSRVRIEVLPPVDLRDVTLGDEGSIRAGTDRLMAAIAASTGQECATVYAKPGSAR